MAIEFDVKMRNPVPTRSLLEKVSSHLLSFGVPGDLESDLPADANLGASEGSGVVRLGELEASLLCHKAAEESEIGEDGGFWLTVDAARSRSGAGIFLAAIVAIAAAEECDSVLLDEGALLRLGRNIRPDTALAQLRRLAGRGNLDEIDRRLGERVGLRGN